MVVRTEHGENVRSSKDEGWRLVDKKHSLTKKIVEPLHAHVNVDRYDSLQGSEEFSSQNDANVCQTNNVLVQYLSNEEDVGSIGALSLPIQNKITIVLNNQQRTLLHSS